jgi:MoaA/NifB/PqqE/SkfB family radical SAM enzyme
MEELTNLVKDKNKLLVVAGVLHSRMAFTGPEVLHIDLTNLCNFNCVACWCRSPLLGDKAMPEWERKLTLPLDIIKGVFDDLNEMGGLRQVKLVGGGEPFVHPDILEIVEYIKNKDRSIEIDINTNFSLVDEKVAEKILKLGVDSLTVSTWAGTPGVYAAVHPNQSEQTFHKIKEILKFILRRKMELNRPNPRIVIHDVVFNLNCKDVEQMLEFALEVGADNVQFVPVDTVKEKTEVLLPNEQERKDLLDILYKIRQHYTPENFRYSYEGRSIVLADFDEFIRRIKELNTKSGVYDEAIVEEIPCYVGWLFARIMATGNVVPCCKGHRMHMGNIYKNRFKEIWFSDTYNEFRNNGLNLAKEHPYFAKIGNDASSKTGCYNCDNLWQNIPMRNKLALLKKYNLDDFCGSLLKNLFNGDKKNIK